MKTPLIEDEQGVVAPKAPHIGPESACAQLAIWRSPPKDARQAAMI